MRDAGTHCMRFPSLNASSLLEPGNASLRNRAPSEFAPNTAPMPATLPVSHDMTSSLTPSTRISLPESLTHMQPRLSVLRSREAGQKSGGHLFSIRSSPCTADKRHPDAHYINQVSKILAILSFVRNCLEMPVHDSYTSKVSSLGELYEIEFLLT